MNKALGDLDDLPASLVFYADRVPMHTLSNEISELSLSLSTNCLLASLHKNLFLKNTYPVWSFLIRSSCPKVSIVVRSAYL